MIGIGIAFGLYAGLWWAFVGGIMDIINALYYLLIISLKKKIGYYKFK